MYFVVKKGIPTKIVGTPNLFYILETNSYSTTLTPRE